MEKSRITKLAIGIVILCFVLSTFVSLWSLRSMAQHNMRDFSRMMAARIYDSIREDLAEPIFVSQTMAHDALFIDLLRNEADYGEDEIVALMERYLTSIKDGLGYESAFAVSEASKRYYSFSGLYKRIDPDGEAYDRWYTLFVGENKPYALDVDRDEMLQDAWTVFVDARVEDADGTLLGVCGVGVHMTGSQELFKALENEYKVKINLADAQGLVQVDTDENNIQKVSLADLTADFHPSGEYVYRRVSGDRTVITKYLENLDWYLVVQSDGSTERGEILSVIMLNVGLCALVLVILLIAIRIIVVRTKALTHASFRDQLTQLYNRRAFEEEKERLMHSELPTDFIYMTADLNGLKTANDDLGHAAGDELIQGAADCLTASFGKYGQVFRIGGDEFAVMMNVSQGKFKEVKQAFENAAAAWSGSQVKSLSLSCGYTFSREFPSANITELIRISDERMYAEKERYYTQNGLDRRRT